MRCIEMCMRICTRLPLPINRNMRCIEIPLAIRSIVFGAKINRNMRCIEMAR